MSLAQLSQEDPCLPTKPLLACPKTGFVDVDTPVRVTAQVLGLLAQLCQLGVDPVRVGDRLRHRPHEPVALAVPDLLKMSKPALLVILGARQVGRLADLTELWPEDPQEHWGERSAIMEYHGDLPPDVTEHRALLEMLSHVGGL